MSFGWFADAVDAALVDMRPIVFALLAAHVAIGIVALAQRRIPRLMPGLNLALASLVALYHASRFAANPALVEMAREGLEQPILALVAFEAVVAVAGVLALAGSRVAAAVSAAAFVVHALANAAFAIFVLTFRLDRLF